MKVYLVLRSDFVFGDSVVSVHADLQYAMQNCAWLNDSQTDTFVLQEIELEA